ncbi:YXWGXW repeat-containing protein [Massilia sp. TWP1-3-3]|uniref:YXWGXW repeat-containing protein n=1 Tax=Massilia sp. TWP1-3-3 TaxID=2804573 RepID=UPI003CF91C77
MKKLLVAAMLAGSLGTVAAPASSAIIVVRQAPPAPRTEAVPAARRGHVWVPGHWDWRGERYVWVKGNYMRERRSYMYDQPSWEERDGRWHRTGDAWRRGNRDNDGDGVKNRDDNRPNNPNRN